MTKPEQMQEQLTNWELSGLSVKEYCLQVGLNVQKFHYWRKKLKHAKAPSPAFIKLHPRQEFQAMKIVYPNGVQLEFSPQSDLHTIGRLIQLYPCSH